MAFALGCGMGLDSKTKCGHCESTKGFEAIKLDRVVWGRPVEIIRCKTCYAAIGVVELDVADEVRAVVEKDIKERE